MAADTSAWLALATGTGLVLGLGFGMTAGFRQVRNLRAVLRDYQANMQQAREQLEHFDERARIAELRAQRLDSRVENLERQLVDRERRAAVLRDEAGKLERELVEAKTTLREREEQHTRQLQLMVEGREGLKREFEHLAARIFDERGRQLTRDSSQSLEALLKPFREQIEGFRARVDRLHSVALRGQGALEAEIRKVMDVGLQMSSEATNLSLALRGDKKTTGNWGEAQLERSLQLAGLEPGEHYEAQAPFRDPKGRQRYPRLCAEATRRQTPGDRQQGFPGRLRQGHCRRLRRGENPGAGCPCQGCAESRQRALRERLCQPAGRRQPGFRTDVHADRARLHRGAAPQSRAVQLRLRARRHPGLPPPR